MELKTYQKKALRDVSDYLSVLNRDNDIFTAWKDFWAARDIHVGAGGVPAYNNAIPGVPHICLKVPTGERVIIVMGALNVILSRVSRTLTKYYSYIA